MATLGDFGDFMKSTAPAWASSQEAFVNELQERNYPLARFLKGRDTSETFQNGERIKDGIILDAAGTFQMIDPETESVWTNTQTLSEWQIPWRFAQSHMTWTAQEVELNEGSSAAVWKRVKKIKQTGLANDVVNGMNAKLFLRPAYSKMESFTAAPGEPQSIVALVNEYASGLWAPGAPISDTYSGGTVQGINPATKTRWQPVRKSYANFDAAPAGGTTNLLMAFDDIFLDLQFRQPGTMNEYFESTDMFRQVIYCTKDGIVKYKKILRDANDVQVTPSRQDPAYVNATYAGIPLERAPQLETELLYGNANATVPAVESSTTNSVSGPRYYWVNANYMKMAFHSNYYFKYLDVFSPERNRTKYVMPIQTWFNLYVTSRRHHGIVYPSANL